MKELFERLKEKLEYGGTYYEGELIGMFFSLVACFIFIMGMLLIFG